MTPFGKNSKSYEFGYDLVHCLGHLEGLLEAEKDKRRNKKQQALFILVENAIEKLTKAADMGEES